MLLACIITNILAIALPSLRIATIALLYAAALSFNVVYIQSIGSGMIVFSGLFIDFFSVQHFTGEEILLFSLVPVKPNPSQDSSTDQQAESASLKYFKEIYNPATLGYFLSFDGPKVLTKDKSSEEERKLENFLTITQKPHLQLRTYPTN